DEFAVINQSKEFWYWPGGRISLQSFDRARRQYQHAMRRLAAERLLPGESGRVELVPLAPLAKGGSSRIANRKALPIGRAPIILRIPHVRENTVRGKDAAEFEIGARKVG